MHVVRGRLPRRGAVARADRLTRYLGIDSDPVNHELAVRQGPVRLRGGQQRATGLRAPQVRKGGELVEVSWGEALDAVADGLRGQRRHGRRTAPGAVGVIGGARLANEDAYAWAKLAKGVLGTDNVDCQLGDGLPAEARARPAAGHHRRRVPRPAVILKIAAVAPNAGLRAGRPDPDDTSVPEVEDCEPERPMPVLTFHGQQDVVNPYTGNGDLRWGYTVPVALQTWARIDGCRRGPNATPVSENVTRLAYTHCRDHVSVELYRVANGGHTWPGSNGPPHGPGLVTREIDASRLIWDFFERYRLRH